MIPGWKAGDAQRVIIQLPRKGNKTELPGKLPRRKAGKWSCKRQAGSRVQESTLGAESPRKAPRKGALGDTLHQPQEDTCSGF